MAWLNEINDAPIEFAGGDTIIEENVHIGYNRLTRLREGYKQNSPVKIGKNVHIRSGTIIYAGCEIGDNVHIGHNVLLREFTKIGDNTSIGSGCVCEGYTIIGHDTRIQAQCHLTSRMTIGNFVFLGALVSTMNDKKMRYARSEVEDSPDIGPTIEDGVAMGSSVIVLPQVKVGIGAIIGAGALLCKNVEPFMLYIGNPAKKIRHVERQEVVDSLQEQYRNFINELYKRDRDGWE